jgi:hypothetical protein
MNCGPVYDMSRSRPLCSSSSKTNIDLHESFDARSIEGATYKMPRYVKIIFFKKIKIKIINK